MSGVYTITNTLNGKIYIGSAFSFKKRWNEHKNDLRNNRHKNVHLQRTWNKDKEPNFKFEILEKVIDPNLLLDFEQKWLDSIPKEFKYNMSESAYAAMTNRTHTQKSKKKIGIANSGENNPNYGKRGYWFNKQQSKESNLKRGVSLKGKMAGKTHPMYGKLGKDNPNYGSKRSIETKRKMSRCAKMRFVNPENHPSWKGGISPNWKRKVGQVK
jgi:group I intron endonuclease